MPPRHHRIRWTVISISAVILVILVTGGWLAYRAISVINTKRLDGSKLSFFQQFAHIVTANDQPLQGEADDRVNILLLGYGGPGHDGPYLTDTMMVASFQPSTKKLALISIPRDLVVDIPGYDYRKINNVLSFGRDQGYPGGGEALTVKVVSDLLNLPIQYYARVDFSGFQEVIDLVGGVSVTVDRAFSDYQYPDNNYGYAPIKFTAGPQTMNGDQALKFTRSRHGNNGEGSDFARAARQQKIIVALKEKILSFGTLANPMKISDILGSLGTHSQTNMEVWEMLRFAKLAGNVQTNQIINKVLDNGADGFLRATTGSGGAFILVPRDGTYQDIQFLARNIFLVAAAEAERAQIIVVNASAYPTLGTATAHTLEALGFRVLKTMSLSAPVIGQTLIVTPAAGSATTQILALYRHAVGALSLASWGQQTGDATLAAAFSTPVIVNTNSGSTNTNQAKTSVLPTMVLVLGQDQPKLPSTNLLPTTTMPTTSNTNSAKTTNTNTKSTNTNTIKNKNSNSTSTTLNTNRQAITNTNIIPPVLPVNPADQ